VQWDCTLKETNICTYSSLYIEIQHLNSSYMFCRPPSTLREYTHTMWIPVAARSKEWVCGRSLAGNVGSNSAGGMEVCLVWVLCVVM
jgi:hypothetical protein